MPKSSKISRTFILTIFFVLLAIIIALCTRTQIQNEYFAGIDKINQGNYYEAINILRPLGNYKDCDKYIEYATGLELFNDECYEESIEIFSSLMNFKDSQSLLIIATAEIEMEQMKSEAYKDALHYYDLAHYAEALDIFERLESYEDSVQLAEECKKKFETPGKLYYNISWDKNFRRCDKYRQCMYYGAI